MARLAAFVLGLCTVLGLSLQAHAAGWTICNRTPEELHVAIAYFDEVNKWMSEGWWALRSCGGCKFVMDHSKTERTNVFFRAVTKDGSERVGGDTRFCVTPHSKGAPPWTGRSGSDCDRRGYLRVGFSLQVINTQKDFTTNIRPPAGGRVCID